MTQHVKSDSEQSSTNNYPGSVTRVSSGFAVALIAVIAFTTPAAATAGNGLCGTEGAPSLINSGLKVTFQLGVVGILISWQLENLLGIFVRRQESKQKLKQRKGDIVKAGIFLIASPVLFKYIGGQIGIEFAHCLDLIPW